MKAAAALMLACALFLPGCTNPTYRLPEHARVRAWDPEQAKDVLRASLGYSGMRDIHVGDASFSYVEPLPGPLLDTCERYAIRYDDVACVELEVTQVDYRVVLRLRSRDGADGAELSFATRRSARNCADAVTTLRGR